MDERLKWMALGVASLLFIKYVVVGLDEWDGWLHPGRREPHFSAFRKPFLGLL
jgi:hypothetical protein